MVRGEHAMAVGWGQAEECLGLDVEMAWEGDVLDGALIWQNLGVLGQVDTCIQLPKNQNYVTHSNQDSLVVTHPTTN